MLLELGCLWHPAAPLGWRSRPPHAAGMGGDFAQLREIAAEKEATWIKQKTKGWIYSWGATEVMRVEP